MQRGRERVAWWQKPIGVAAPQSQKIGSQRDGQRKVVDNPPAPGKKPPLVTSTLTPTPNNSTALDEALIRHLDL